MLAPRPESPSPSSKSRSVVSLFKRAVKEVSTNHHSINDHNIPSATPNQLQEIQSNHSKPLADPIPSLFLASRANLGILLLLRIEDLTARGSTYVVTSRDLPDVVRPDDRDLLHDVLPYARDV